MGKSKQNKKASSSDSETTRSAFKRTNLDPHFSPYKIQHKMIKNFNKRFKTLRQPKENGENFLSYRRRQKLSEKRLQLLGKLKQELVRRMCEIQSVL